MMDIKNIPGKLKTTCQFCVWKFEKRNGQKTKMPYNPATGERAKINDLRTFADFKTTLVTYAMGGYDGIGIAVGNGIGAFDIDHCIREDGTLNDTADTVLSIFPTAYVEKSPSGKGLRLGEGLDAAQILEIALNLFVWGKFHLAISFLLYLVKIC